MKEIEASHTLGRAGEGRVQGRGKWRGYTRDDTLLQNNTVYPYGLVEGDCDTRSGRTWKKSKDLSADLVGGGVYATVTDDLITVE